MTVFENSDWIILNKPPGISAQEDLTDGFSVLKEYPGTHVLTRLDKRVSGLMILGKSAEAARKWPQEKLKKRYHCVVLAPGPGEKGTLRHYLQKVSTKARIVGKKAPDAKPAVLHYTCVQRSERYVLLEIEIETGRFHQIRAQMSAAGYPLVGDLKYGAKRSSPDGSLFLCCTSVEGPGFKVEISIPELWERYGFTRKEIV
jgi:23S rRNA pseudouridine1911/1915/1917 synthase